MARLDSSRPSAAFRRDLLDTAIGRLTTKRLRTNCAEGRLAARGGTVTRERIRELTKGMLRKRLDVVLSKGGDAPDAIAEYLPRHLEYMIGLEQEGVRSASGPLAAAAGRMRADGL